MKTFTIIGGDLRSTAAALRLTQLGFAVKIFALKPPEESDGHISCCLDLAEALQNADYVLLPLPCSTGNDLLSTPFYEGSLTLSSVIHAISKQQIVFGGKMDSSLTNHLQAQGIRYYDYALREEFAVLNAIATAEGAIEIALRELPCTLNDSQVLITGFGRIAKILAHTLQGFGAKVCVAARKYSDLAWMKAYGYEALHIQDLKHHADRFQVVYNTVPHRLFERELLCRMKKDCLLVDLASKPGGVDFESAEKLGLSVIWALSLPGKCAPTTAGTVICDTVLNILSESEVNL